MQKRKNDVKARTTLLLSLPDENQLRFSKYKTAQELWAVILKTFGGNEATTKTKKNLLKQQYGNFKAEGSETLEQTFNKLQVIVGHLLTPLVETVDRIFFLVRQGESLSIHITFTFNSKQEIDQQNPTLAKIPFMGTGSLKGHG
nr:ribonuclease H-like domain-containing protein [Tanacetum cinerariifolium]